MNQPIPMKHADHPAIEQLRVKFPYHVEIKHWKQWGEEGDRPTLAEIQHDWGTEASWCDYWATKTFGFSRQKEAEGFAQWASSEVVHYQPVVVDETVPPQPEPPPADDPLAGMEREPG